MKKLKHFLALWGLIAFGLLANPLNAQVSEGGVPPSFAYPDVLKSFKAPAMVYADFDVAKQIELDKKQREEAGSIAPVKIGKMLPVNFTMENSGEWTTLPDGTEIWRLTIQSPDALAIMLYYDEFYIPEGGKLFIYNATGSQVLGAYTNKTNPNRRKFATEFIIGDKLTLEYVSEGGSSFDAKFISKMNIPKIKITDVIYGYDNIVVYDEGGNVLKTGWYNRAENSCMVNVNCSEGASWQDQKKGVAASVAPVVSAPGYVGLCSGTVVNNTLQDLTPYYLTAWHCFEEGSDYYLDQALFYFHYELPGCEMLPTAPTGSKTITGAEILVSSSANGGSDGMLLQLLQNIPEDYDVYYNGWDRRDIPATSGVGIHHPGADVKKISTFTAPATTSTWNGGGYIGATNAHWTVSYVATANGHSVTEAGSSGSPLFNQDGLVVGTLTGGNSSCSYLNGINRYGKFWYHWDKEVSQEMKQYLDPSDSGAETLPGTYVAGTIPTAAFAASATDIYALESVTYVDKSSLATTWTWTFAGGTPASSTEKNPPAVTYNAPGVYETKLVINKDTPEESEATKTITVTLKGGTPVAPVANFSLVENVIFEEYFSATSIPTGWTVEKRGAGSETWRRFSSSTSPSPDPVSPTSFAYHRWDDYNMVDGWLISPSIAIPAIGADAQFYCSGGGSYHQYALTYFYVIDAANTEVELWNNGHLVTSPTYVWDHPSIDLSAYAGQTVKLAWRYQGQGGDAAMIDGVVVKTYDPSAKVTINVGDYVTPINLSIGPPVFYEWTFNGSETPTSDKENPGQIRYMNPGVYDVALWVKNTIDENTRTLTGAVTVVDVVPEVAYEASIGYTRRENYGLFLPTGAEVDFTDKSLNYPTSWEWTFEGGTPASAATRNVEGVEFAAEGEFDFKFKATNGAGSGEINIPDGTKVGYARDTIWNMSYGESGSEHHTYTYGNLTGTNSYDQSALAEFFDAPAAPAAITGVKINITASGGSSADKLAVSIANVASTGYPGTIIATASLAYNNINPTGPTEVSFSEPVIVDEPFFVIVGDPTGSDGSFDAVGFTGHIWASPDRGEEGKNTTYTHDWFYYYLCQLGLCYEPWAEMPLYNGMAISMDVAPILTYVNFKGVTNDPKKFNFKNIDPTTATVNVEGNIPWKATTDAPWIIITDGEHDGDGSFTIGVKDNKFNARRAFVKVSAGEGTESYVLVQQAGPNPTDLTATVVDEENAELIWNAPAILDATTAIYFDDIEGHASFALDSPGEIGWTYIDGDGGSPTAISYGGETFPNANIPSSFMVYVPSETTPPITHSIFAPRSGNKYLACPKNYTGEANNDWIVSPALDYAGDFTFSFWARSLNAPSYVERIRVAYSTTGNTQADFTNVVSSGAYESVPAAWTKYEFTIPANAKYVALNCVSNAAFMLLVDDIFIGIGEAPQSSHQLMSATSGEVKFTEKTPADSNKRRANFTEARLQEKLKDRSAARKEAAARFMKQSEQDGVALRNAAAGLQDDVEFPTTKLRYDNNVNDNAIRLNTSGDIELEVAIRFTPQDLLKYQGAKMKAVDIFVMYAPSDGVVVNVRQGDEVIHSQQAAVVSGKWNRIALDKEVTVEAWQDLYVGYAGIQRNAQAIFGIDQGPVKKMGYSDLMSIEGDPFESLYLLSGGQLSANWNLALIVEDKDDLIDVAYKVYRDNGYIETTRDITYLDEALVTNTACYEVTAFYNGELESTPSNVSCVTLKNMITVAVANATRYVGEANPNFVITASGTFLPGHTAAQIAGLFSATTLANEQSQPGEYDIAISPLTHADYRFAYQHGTLTVVEKPEEPFVINPETNAFTPYDKDGYNDIFMPGTAIEVVNRYGQNIFSGRDGWDGTRKNGQLVPPGSYYYKATLTDGRVLRGSVEVVKK
ncbi:MAG: choice-of-anchor J domain-containing protein [Prevotellaceae bacterium]|jgi:PKD repeat protein|nr:choice-of-anchor J domain-containing protein [Prevotellaceae bacterium]